MKRDELYAKYIGVRNINAVLKHQNAELLALLRRVEWSFGIGVDVCPICKRHKSKGHADDCELREAIDGR